jgi:hypothetical protein
VKTMLRKKTVFWKAPKPSICRFCGVIFPLLCITLKTWCPCVLAWVPWQPGKHVKDVRAIPLLEIRILGNNNGGGTDRVQS